MEPLLGIVATALPFLESGGIIGGLFFTGWSLWIDAKVRRVQNLITLTAHHREIWSELYKNSSLKRVLDPNADLEKQPISIQERLFVRSLFLHLSAAFQASKSRMFFKPDRLERDVHNFLKLPIPKLVWNQSKESHNSEYVAFVENQTA